MMFSVGAAISAGAAALNGDDVDMLESSRVSAVREAAARSCERVT